MVSEEQEGEVVMADIIKPDSAFPDFGNIETEQEIRVALAQLSSVKEMLEAADRFREESIKFARYEAYALVRAVEISGDSHLIKGKWRRQAAEWLAGLTESERESYIAMCSEGKTIDHVYRKMVVEPHLKNELGKAVEECKAKAKQELKDTGVVSVQQIVRNRSMEFPRSMLSDITDGVRKAVLKSGGVGIGDESGTYINPDVNSAYISDAIATRISAISRDIESVADLASRSTSKPAFNIKGDGSNLTFMEVTYLILSGIGCANVSFSSKEARDNCTAILKQIAGGI